MMGGGRRLIDLLTSTLNFLCHLVLLVGANSWNWSIKPPAGDRISGWLDLYL
ncbi:hypothetical protein DCAR_0831100 [Daucus carota subsp. sativus]|uniref:Uncharacterized protein n=1 Tax=Daucus carota subsp. sativus TaxID=79200 RepID=A0A175YL08_DAUCS|nr:hypothetical protein DCAR_0831100 [Daucus carota subsp. sativus]